MNDFDPKDIKVEYKGNTIKAYAGDVLIWDDIDNDSGIIYNQSTPAPLNLDVQVKHYHDMNTTELYKSYGKILEMIERFEKQTKQGKRYQNAHEKWTMNDLRAYCQVWLDDVRFRQDGNNRWWVWDRCKYFLRGQLKERIMWLKTFGTICYDMCARLDAIDGGNAEQPVEQPVLPQHRIGF